MLRVLKISRTGGFHETTMYSDRVPFMMMFMRLMRHGVAQYRSWMASLQPAHFHVARRTLVFEAD